MTTTWGKYIDTWIRLKQPASAFKLTEFIKEVIAKSSDLSDRQIQRMRDLREGELPESKSLMKLVEAFEDLQMLNPNDICDRLLLPWIPVEKRQSELVNSVSSTKVKNTITIVSGWQAPAALSDDRVIAAVIKNLAVGFSYRFLYPSPENYAMPQEQQDALKMVKDWVEDLRLLLEGEWYRQAIRSRGREERSVLDRDLAEFRITLQQQIKEEFTKKNSNFWFLLPSDYVVLYNIEPEHEHRPNAERYGVMRVSGVQLPISTNSPETTDLASIRSAGWLYLEQDVYDALAQEINLSTGTKAKGSKSNTKSS
ncbi:MAG: hypothetical protein AUK48_00395 [Oscillatoriales cyanobacterium CG2_30_44_21]|nr:MAG: hypothetical protein AUK48_00395 [Oscillatoriales cyanobacterium CG2_30_44_21]